LAREAPLAILSVLQIEISLFLRTGFCNLGMRRKPPDLRTAFSDWEYYSDKE
jgi:hypothetical protein